MPNQNDNNNILSLILPGEDLFLDILTFRVFVVKALQFFFELKLLLSTPLNSPLQVFGISETKL